jgi:dTDP-4-amino-4,6-dideoxygalactose transaminase
MERIDEFLGYRKKVVARYDDQLKISKGLFFRRVNHGQNIYWLYSIIVDEKRPLIATR